MIELPTTSGRGDMSTGDRHSGPDNIAAEALQLANLLFAADQAVIARDTQDELGHRRIVAQVWDRPSARCRSRATPWSTSPRSTAAAAATTSPRLGGPSPPHAGFDDRDLAEVERDRSMPKP
jgi:hypothetical protein